MSPSAIELPIDSRIKDFVVQKKDTLPLPEASRIRLEKAGIDLSNGYPERPAKPLFLDDAFQIRNIDREHVDAGARADKSKSPLLSAAKEVIHLNHHIGTEIVGLQLKDLTDQQRDELALLIAERSVVFFRDQDITPQEQKTLGEYFGEVEIHPQVPHVPGVPGVTVIWPALHATEKKASYRQPGGASRWHSDLVHENIPRASPTCTMMRSHQSVETHSGQVATQPTPSSLLNSAKSSTAAKQFISVPTPTWTATTPTRARSTSSELTPLSRVHPATGWKSLYVNRAMTKSIVGLDKAESDLVLNYLYDVYETNVDIQVRFKWTPRTSALWDNRITIHNASWDYEGSEPRHGTRVTSLAEKPYFEAGAPTRREALGLADD